MENIKIKGKINEQKFGLLQNFYLFLSNKLLLYKLVGER